MNIFYFFVIFIFMSLIVTSCKNDDNDVKSYDYREYQTTEPIKVENTYTENDTVYSYWFVVWMTPKGDRVNSIIVQPHSYFSMKEFKKDVATKNDFLLNLVPVTR